MEDRTYSLNELALMTGLTTRTLRNYMNQGILHGEKVNGIWQFTIKDIEVFFEEPYVKEGILIKRNSVVFDFLADRKKESGRICVILDRPASFKEGESISSFFCKEMESAKDVVFSFDWDKGCSRVIVSGAEDQVMQILKKYY